MKVHQTLILTTLLVGASVTHAAEYDIRVVASGLQRPAGIVALTDNILFFTQLPTPGVPGSQGGGNTVDALLVPNGKVFNLASGEPEPTNLALDRFGRPYWTCKSAGVILRYTLKDGVELVLSGLDHPSGIALDRRGNVFFTLLPTPGVPGSMGGGNGVAVFDGAEVTELLAGNPAPTDIAVRWDGEAYWTCQTAGVILKREMDGTVTHVLDNLDSPTGIALDGWGRNLYFTEGPTPGVPGSMGGGNRVMKLNLDTMELELIHEGDPQPQDVTVSPRGDVFWTCTSAGVIVQARIKHPAPRGFPRLFHPPVRRH